MTEGAVIGSGLAARYATALMELAKDRDQIDHVASELDSLASAVDENDDLASMIKSPLMRRDDQVRAMAAICDKAGFSDLTKKVVGLMADQRRLFALPDMVASFKAMVARERGEVQAEVVSAQPLTEEQERSLKETVGAEVGQNVVMTSRVDPDLLGGLVLRVGSRMVDASVRTKLRHLELAMRGAG
ncbi:MAG: F0F1 ATP synthase subunit delta [Geminicoccaceae bacterium]